MTDTNATAPAAAPEQTPAPAPAPTKEQLDRALQTALFELGRKTYVYEAERRVLVDAIAKTANDMQTLAQEQGKQAAIATAVKNMEAEAAAPEAAPATTDGAAA